MPRVSQEFYCNECDGYFIVRLNTKLNHEAVIRCPNCGHEHRRCVKNGEIYEQGRFSSDHKETILPTKTSYSKKPFTEEMRKNARDGVRVPDGMREEMYDRWVELAERTTNGPLNS